MMMADEGLNYYTQLVGDEEIDSLGDDMCFEVESLLDMLEENADALQSNQEDLLSKDVSQGQPTCQDDSRENSQLQNGSEVLRSALPVRNESSCHDTFHSTYITECSDSRTRGFGASFNSSGNSLAVLNCVKPEVLVQTELPANAYSAGLTDWSSQISWDATSWLDQIGVSQIDRHTCSTPSSFAEATDAIHFSDQGGDFYPYFRNGETEARAGHVRRGYDSKYYSQNPTSDHADVNLGNHGTLDETSMETLGLSDNNSCPSVEISMRDANFSSQNATSIESNACQSSDILRDFHGHNSATHHSRHTPQFYFSSNYSSQVGLGYGEMRTDTKDEVVEFPSTRACSNSSMIQYMQGGTTGKSASMVSMVDGLSDRRIWNYNCEGGNLVPSINGNNAFDANDGDIDNEEAMKLSMWTLTNDSRKEQLGKVKNERTDAFNDSRSGMWRSSGLNNGRMSYIADEKVLNKNFQPSPSGVSSSILSQNHDFVDYEEEDIFFASKGGYHSQDMCHATNNRSSVDGGHLNVNVLDPRLPCAEHSTLNKQSLGLVMGSTDSKLTPHKSMVSHLKKADDESNHSNFLDKSHVEDDPDICIIEERSHPAPSSRPLVVGNSVVTSQGSRISDYSHGHMGAGSMRHKARDESLILSVALQDLSQPKSEASAPDGVLAVPLLRHQRIALSWMVQKETGSSYCSGGILADDQGLGKTISMIALILKERPPSIQASQNVKHGESETLNLDDDEDDNDDVRRGYGGTKQEADSHQVTSSCSTRSMSPLAPARGRPAAGTLVVCPTSVLRQWAEELHNKVTGKANLSVLVYHGSNRTKDPCELAKYDVVLTTYAIVSMEVPKQSAVDEDDDEKAKEEDHVFPPLGLSSGKKRKYPPSSGKKSSKGNRGMDSALFEAVARPLAKVGWFRVVLDEAQSIKNHRTQVARACWGLRAKRRWCLSGTPIQNAIDDLYSYFRFLRYDPYAAYKSFCSAIKFPISRNPSKGYKKLQAVLHTIMLRRTKGTLLDGKPIISLPPKFIELKKVDFTKEERDFYSRLEADSRAQFEEYAAAGTVKQNYVNILLMLLRLRQACDHPLLVKPYNSNSLWRSSVDIANKLPLNKQISLLNCLEASLAICGICNDAPEDAVVSECGHVFCKQCICEHLSGDDNQCPTPKCKYRLTISSIFSRSTLDTALSDQPGCDNSANCCGSDVIKAVEVFSGGCLYDSSKIKATLEVLHSLCKPPNCTFTQKTCEGIASCHKDSDSQSMGVPEGTPQCQNLTLEKISCDSKKVGGEKAIVFSQWTRMLDLLEACLKNSSIQYRRLDGTMSVLARDKAVKDFNTLPEVSVMIMSLKAASLGLNMVAACHVLLLDLWWNPTTEDQAIDRAHRIGQTRPVTVFRLTVRDTVEDRILALQQKKRKMVSSAFGEDETGGRQTRLTVEDLKYLFMM